MMNPQEHKIKQKARILKNLRLRKVRYELRTLFFLFFEEKKKEINQEISISFDGSRERLKSLLREREHLIFSFCRSSINCSLCGSREEDLIYQLDDQMWICHNRERCHQRIEQDLQDFKNQVRDSHLISNGDIGSTFFEG